MDFTYISESKFEGAVMIKDAQLPTPRGSPLRERASSLGLLDRLPLELMFMIIRQLDFQSVTRLSRVSCQGDNYVRSCLEYRDLLKLVPTIVEALRRLGLTGLHPVADLWRALRSELCATCGARGLFLFLPTCERCCLGCLEYYPSLQMMTPSLAQWFYDLEEEHTQQLLTIRVMVRNVYPGVTPRPGYVSHVKAKAARDLALAVHGSEEKLSEAVYKRCRSQKARDYAWYWLEAHTGPPRWDWVRDHGCFCWLCRKYMATEYATMYSIPFPVLKKDGELQGQLWCQRCKHEQ